MRPTVFLMKGLARTPQNENQVQFKAKMPISLKNRVSSKSTSHRDRGCLYEMSLVLNCLQKNNNENKLCTKEVNLFRQCYSTYLTNKHYAKEQARKGVLTPNSKNLKYNQINQLLRKYPHV